jgi:hypothetical protein
MGKFPLTVTIKYEEMSTNHLNEIITRLITVPKKKGGKADISNPESDIIHQF